MPVAVDVVQRSYSRIDGDKILIRMHIATHYIRLEVFMVLEQVTKPNFFFFSNMAGNDNGKNIGDLVASANANQSKAVDPTSPYYLHLSDHPGLIFMAHPLNESGDNYFTWRRSFMNTLHSKNKASFMDGTIAKLAIDSLDFTVMDSMQCSGSLVGYKRAC
ncbi:hypothetical protein RJ639_021956 [Escallonia herrerae]|uniref:Retrotransposon Copia-like N-terminal domain-containing protein n=1 Tax=Escallonia herrerae TaxID=1293975 RepID=A0AA89AFH8_9ASTE|nr:hypothetical protein RJ639_021956 [Escallonia herrerae]